MVDPVIGDIDSGIYVKLTFPSVSTIFTALAQGITPNIFELEILTGIARSTVPLLPQKVCFQTH